MSAKKDKPPLQKENAPVVVPDKINAISIKKRWLKLKPTRRNIERGEKIVSRHAKKFIIGRWDNLRLVRREIAAWLVLVGFLLILSFVQSGIYNQNSLTVAPTRGGTYAEGIEGRISTINPLYAGTDRERTVSKLVYSGLFEYDDTGNLRPELASSYSISEDGNTYNVKLRSDVRWSDDKAFTADDVILTVNLIKDPKVDSAIQNSWKTVEIKKINDLEVAFSLKSSFASFPYALTFGILPSHILKDINPANVRNFVAENTSKIAGTGAFVYRSKESLANNQSRLHFAANQEYFRGRPYLSAFDVQTYASSGDLLTGFKNKEVNAAVGLGKTEATDSLTLADSQLVQTSTADGVFALFNNSGQIASDKTVREALRLGADRNALRLRAVTKDNSNENQLDIPKSIDTPILPESVSGIEELKQPDYDAKVAAEKLDAAGWKLNSNNKREKDGAAMSLSMVTVKGTDYEAVAKLLAEQWRQLGIEVDLTIADPANIQQSYFITRDYDVLVYQIHIGADPDVLAYWGSSQANARGLNLANYKSPLSDLALANARAQLNDTKRAARYVDFTKRWINDAPAIALYRPNLYYLKTEQSNSIDANRKLVDATSRYSDVQNWTIETKMVKQTP